MKRNKIPVLIFFLAIILSGCGMVPRIIVLSNPLSGKERINLGVTYEKNGDLAAALKEYKSATRKTPLGYYYMGNVYFKEGQYKKAEFCYKAVIKYYPRYADAYNNLAWLYYKENEKLNEAEELAEKAIELNPNEKAIYMDTLEKIKKEMKVQRKTNFSW